MKPLVTEMNPNHPLTQEMREHYQTLLIALMGKLGVKEVTLTYKDLDNYLCSEGAEVLSIHGADDYIVLKMISRKEAEALMDEHGGAPH